MEGSESCEGEREGCGNAVSVTIASADTTAFSVSFRLSLPRHQLFWYQGMYCSRSQSSVASTREGGMLL